MALSFPRPLPLIGSISGAMDIQRVDLQSPVVGGPAPGVSLGLPRWTLALTLGDADAAETAEWSAWIDSLRGTQRAFFGRDLTRPFPRSCPNGFAGLTRAGGGAFDGTATSWSVNADRDVVTLSGLPAALALTHRDGIMWRWTGAALPGRGSARRALSRCVEPVAASGGGSVAFAIEPPLPAFVPGGAIADLAEPCCVMVQTPDSPGLGELDALHSASGSLKAIQDLRA